MARQPTPKSAAKSPAARKIAAPAAKPASGRSKAQAVVAEVLPTPAKRAAVSRKVKAAAPAVATPMEAVTKTAKAAVRAVTTDVSKASATAKKAVTSAKRKAAGLVSHVDAPSLPTGDVSHFVKSMGNQIVGALNTDVGRVMVAELLIHVAKSLTKAAANTEIGKDTTGALMTAGAKIGAAAASAGARMVESGSSAASSGAEAASGAASSATDLAREVAQVAVSAVGGVVADAASKVMGRRGKPDATPAPLPTPPTSGTRRPPQI